MEKPLLARNSKPTASCPLSLFLWKIGILLTHYIWNNNHMWSYTHKCPKYEVLTFLCMHPYHMMITIGGLQWSIFVGLHLWLSSHGISQCVPLLWNTNADRKIKRFKLKTKILSLSASLVNTRAKDDVKTNACHSFSCPTQKKRKNDELIGKFCIYEMLVCGGCDGCDGREYEFWHSNDLKRI